MITGAIFIVAWVAFVLGLLAGLELARAPQCTCGDLRCGGACIDWDNAA